MSVSTAREALASLLERLRSTPSALLTMLRESRMEQSRDDVRRLTFWRGVVAEFLGSLFYVLLGCGASAEIVSDETSKSGYVPVIQGALAFGLGYAGIVHCIRSVSGGHVNPSVSFAALVTRKISVARALLYVVAQFLGSILGAAILLGVTASDYHGTLGCTTLARNMSAEQGFGVELFSTFLLVFAWFASFDPKRAKEGQTWAPFGVGLLLVAQLMFAIPYTGGSFNTARSFGPAMVMGVWKNHWVYWFGPVVGGILGGVTYDVMFAANASFKRVNKCMMMVNECEHPMQDDGDDEDDEEQQEQQQQRQRTRQQRRLNHVDLKHRSRKQQQQQHQVKGNHSPSSSSSSYPIEPHSSFSSSSGADHKRGVRDVRAARSVSRTVSIASSSSMEEVGLQTVSVVGSPSQSLPLPQPVAPPRTHSPKNRALRQGAASPQSPPRRPTSPESPPTRRTPPLGEFSIPLPLPVSKNPIPEGMGLLPSMIPLDVQEHEQEPALVVTEEVPKSASPPPVVPPPRSHRRMTPVVSEV